MARYNARLRPPQKNPVRSESAGSGHARCSQTPKNESVNS